MLASVLCSGAIAAQNTKACEEVLSICLPMDKTPLSDAQKKEVGKRLGYYPTAPWCQLDKRQEPNLDFISQGQLKAGDVSLDVGGGADLINEGDSWLKGGVTVKQQNRMLSAESAKIVRQKGQISTIHLLGRVQLFEPGTKLISQRADFNYQTGEGTLAPLLYRMSFKGNNATLENLKEEQTLIAWGYANQVHRDGNERYQFKNAAISICPPQELTWQIVADSLQVDKKTGESEVRSAKLFFHNLPVAYLPYWSFTLDDKRKSGFLIPRVSYRSINGMDVLTPYYINLAPNYDLTLLPHYFEKRGLMAGGDFRYLFPWGEGSFDATFLHDDHLYRSFLIDNALLQPNTDLNRSELNWQHQSRWQNWQFNVEYGELSDDYYPADFNTSLNFTQNNQVKRLASAVFDKESLHFSLKMQRFQTLHPINQSATTDVYRLYPQADLALWQSFNESWRVELQSQLSEFDWQSVSQMPPTGLRLFARPSLHGNFYISNIEFQPSFALDSRYYELENYSGRAETFSSVIPRVYVDASSLYLKDWRWQGVPVQQSLRPRLFYLYVPYQDQNEIPLFDTSETIFSYGQLFDSSRFSGLDRVGDNNRLSIGFESEFYHSETGVPFASFNVGQGYYFSPHRVLDCFSPTGSCQAPANMPGNLAAGARWTPFAFEGMVKLNKRWQVLVNNAYEVSDARMNNGVLDLHYNDQEGHQADLAYAYLKDGDNINLSSGYQNSANLSQIRLSYAWPLNERLKAIAGYSYNFGFGHEMGYFASLQYESCCIASRVLAGRLFNSLGTAGAPEYNNVIYWQVLLKGLGGLTNGSFDGLMSQFARN
jgi:LPS-assembly protein